MLSLNDTAKSGRHNALRHVSDLRTRAAAYVCYGDSAYGPFDRNINNQPKPRAPLYRHSWR